MYNSTFSKWNSVQMGPKRDIVGELGIASRKANLHFGVSSHRIEHWWFFGNGRTFDSDVQDTAFSDFYGPAVYMDGTKPGEKGTLMTAEFMNDWLLRGVEPVSYTHL